MPDLSIEFCGVKATNPFWLASGPPTNSEYQVRRAVRRRLGRSDLEDPRRTSDRQCVVALRGDRLRRP